MFKLAKLTDYAIVALSRLAQLDSGATLSASGLSSDTGIPEPTVAKVLKILTRHGLIASQRGVYGGYSLTRKADTLTLLDVITAIEGPVAITSCVEGSVKHQCGAHHHCPVRGAWDPVNRALTDALAGITLADMARAGSQSCGAAHHYDFMRTDMTRMQQKGA